MDKDRIKEIISSVDSSIKAEDLYPTKLSDEIVEKVLNGEITDDEAVKVLIKKYRSGEYDYI